MEKVIYNKEKTIKIEDVIEMINEEIAFYKETGVECISCTEPLKQIKARLHIMQEVCLSKEAEQERGVMDD